jgi:choline dehydrogenase
VRDAYDYVIVGAGSSGCVLASRLSDNHRNSVLVLESGPEDRNMLLAMPVGIGKLMRSEAGKSYLSFYEVSPGENRPPNFWLKGRTIGGSSSINGMVYMRGMPSDYERWKALGCEGWGWSAIGRAYRELENHELGANAWRGDGGPLRISMSSLNELGRATLAAAVASGTPAVDDINDIDVAVDGGIGPQPATIWRGRRVSASRAFLDVARRRANVDVAPNTTALAIAFDGRQAKGVRLISADGRVRTVMATRDVILSAGAIESPLLLQRSGIGPASLLRQHGIEVQVHAPEVGCNLQDHRTVKVEFAVKRGSRNSQLRGVGLALSALSYTLAGRGALSTCIWELGGLVKTLPNLAEPDCQIGVTFFTHDRKGVCPQPGIALYGYVLRPESRGTVSIGSADPTVPPRITANFLAEEYDRIHTVSLFRYIRRIAGQPELAPSIMSETIPGPNVTSDDDLIETSFAQGACAMHICGTCRMGTDPTSVVDSDLRVRGVGGLRVVDTSVMPRLVSGNTNGPAMALAWHAAERILR